MVSRVAWVLNLDADLELGAGPTYSPTNAVREAMKPHVALLAQSLLGPGDVLVEDAACVEGLVGRAFCPTPRAIARLVRAGAIPEPHPPASVLRQVNGRAFCASLGPTLPGGRFVCGVDEALSVLATPPPIAEMWRVKRAFGMAGRGQRVIRPGAIDEGDRAFLRGSRDGVQIEPDVPIVRELAIHGMLADDGALVLGRVVTQTCDARGQWVASDVSEDLPTLRAEARRVAAALHGAGYFGPFGVDAFEYADRGSVFLQPRSEINARYSMGFRVGLPALSESSESSEEAR